MAIYRFKYLFIIHLNLFLIIFIDVLKVKFPCHHIAAMARMLSLFGNCHYKFPIYFLFQQNFSFSSMIPCGYLTLSLSLLVEFNSILSGHCIWHLSNMLPQSFHLFLVKLLHSAILILHSVIMLPQFGVRFLPRSFRHSISFLPIPCFTFCILLICRLVFMFDFRRLERRGSTKLKNVT